MTTEYADLSPRELVRRSVALARSDRRRARLFKDDSSKVVFFQEEACHAMKLARHIKRAAVHLRSY